MLKKDGWQKKFLRVKQMADQNLGRAEKSEVLSEDLLHLEKRVELMKAVCHNTQKSMQACIQGKGNDVEKRLKKMPESMLAHSMIESGQLLGTDTLMGKMFQICGEAEGSIAADLMQCELEVESKVLAPLQTIDNEINNIHRARKQLTKSVLDMDSARSRYQSAVKQAQGSGGSKVENIRDEMEEASQRVEQCRDQISTDIYTFVSKETEHCQMLVDLINAQVNYHKTTLEVLEGVIPQLQEQIESSSATPVFGGALEDHLNRVKRDISVVLEECICTLLMYGMSEEGLFRIAGSASKVKKLRAAFDSGMVDMREFDSDIHAVAGALKMYLRELPDPLMTTDLYQEWMQAANLPVEQRLQALWMVLDKLPKLNYNNLRYLIKFLAKLAENQDLNKMSPSNIAIVMGPNLMWAPGDGGPSMLSTSMQSAIVEILISHADWFFPEDVNFHQTGKGMSSPAVDRRRSRMPPLPNNLTVPRPRPKSTHVINVAVSSALSAAPPPSTHNDKAANKKTDSSKGSPKSGSGHNTLPRIRLRKSKDKDRTPTPPKESIFSRSHKRESTPKESIGSPKLISGPSQSVQTENIANNKQNNNLTSSKDNLKTELNSTPESASKESTPIAKRKAREMYFEPESFKGGTPERDFGFSSETLGSDFKNVSETRSIDSHSFDKFSISSAPMPYKHSRTASIGSNESSFSATLLGYGNLGGHRRMVHSFTEGNGDDMSDTLSEPANLGRAGSIRHANFERATTPPPKPPPPKGLHKDVYNTVFALQELGTGWSDYLTRVRTLWDGHLKPDSETTEAEPKEVTTNEVPKEAASNGSAPEAPSIAQDATDGSAQQTSALSAPDSSGHINKDVDFGVAPASISPAHSGSNSSLLDSNQNVNHDSAPHSTSRMIGALAESMGPAMIIQTAANVNSTSPSSTLGGQHITPPSSMTASTNSLNSSDDRQQPPSPKLSKKYTKKAPAPPPPGVPERPPVPAASDAPHVTVSPPGESSNRPPIPDRPQAPPPIPPTPSEKLYPSLSGVSEQKPEKPEKPEKPNSPRPDRPKAPPPDRPQFPPPEKPEKPPLPASLDKPHFPSRPELPKPELPVSSGTLTRQERLSSGSGRPPRPQPPPPPPPDRRTSQDNRAPIAEPEPVSPSDCSKNSSDASTYL